MDAILQEVDRGETAEGFTLFSSWAVPYVVDQIMLNQLEGEDPVEHEVDVFLSQALSETLYLFQNPMRPVHMQTDYSLLQDVKLKQSQQKVRAEVPIAPSGENYSDSRGESYANFMELGRPPGFTEPYYASGFLDKQTISGVHGMPQEEVKRYALGFLRGKELHLTSLKGIHRLRPSFEYLDCVGAGEKRSMQCMQEESESSEEEEEPKHVTVKFSRQGQFGGQSQEDEPWMRLQAKSLEDVSANKNRGLLVCEGEMELAGSNVDPKHYFNTLVPAEDKETLSALGSCTPLPDLKDLPLQDAVKTLMMSAGVLRFRTVCSLVEGVSTQQRGVPTQLEEEVLSHLMKVAVLVQGCWVLRSSLFYTEDYHSLYNSVPYTVMCVARDLILLKFALTCQAIVTREEITKQVSIPQEELVEILSSLGRQREGLGWEFRMDMDKEFLSQHSNVVAKQLEWWKTQREKLQSSASQPKEDPTELTKPKALGKKKRPSYGRPNSKEEPSPTACVGVKSEPLPPTPHSEDIVSSLSEWVLKSVGPGVIPLHELRQSLDHHLLSSSSNNDLHSLTGDEEAFVRGLQSAGMCEVDIKDVGMDGDGKPVRLFTRTQVGNDSDRYRCHILEMFKELSSVRKKQVCEEIKRKTGEDPNIKLVTAVLKDLCYSKGALWHLFGT